jgi:predicted dehydrogenase
MTSSNTPVKKLRMGMIGGGPGAFIGAVHRTAACLDGEIELVCGAFSSDPEKSREMGRLLGLSANRVYGSYKEMIEEEQKTKGKNLCRKVLKILSLIIIIRNGFRSNRYTQSCSL